MMKLTNLRDAAHGSPQRVAARSVVANTILGARLVSLKRHRPDFIPNRNTTLLIEGFPRSANTYVREALQLANPGSTFASHLHGLGAIKIARKQCVPTVLLLRHPYDCAASLMVREGYSAPTALWWYINYHHNAMRLLDRGVAVCPFEVATESISRLVEAVNDRFELQLDAPRLDDEPSIRENVRLSEAADAGYVSELRVALPNSGRASALTAAKHEIASLPERLAAAVCLFETLRGSPSCILPNSD
jgi:hypothetical protein